MADYKYVVTISRARAGRYVPESYGFCAGVFSDSIQASDLVESKIRILIDELRARCYSNQVRYEFDKSLKVLDTCRFAWTRRVSYIAPNGTPTMWYFHIEEVEVK